MPNATNYRTTAPDLTVLRELAKRKMEIAHDPVNLERKRLWLEMHAGNCIRPMVLAEWGGIRDQRMPFAPELACTEDWARGIEGALRQEIWVFEELQDDHVVEPFLNVNWNVQCSDYGVQPEVHRVEGDHLTSRRWDAPITDIDRDFHLLHPRTYSVDREQTLGWKSHLEEVFSDSLPIRIRGSFWWTMGMTIRAIDLIGLQNLMLFMYDDPDGLHRLMGFLRDDHLAHAEWLDREQLLSLNNENDYVGSGGIGYTRELPGPDWQEGGPVKTQNLWVLLESQETVGVGPEQFEEFVFAYQKDIADRFGLVYYGCCEPVHTRWDVIKQLPNLRAVSVAPLCNQEIMAEALAGDYVFSRKPNPTLISTPRFDEDLIRQDVRTTLAATKRHNCLVEIAMKDVHTLSNEPQRLARWVQLVREEIASCWG